jgi:hypothetical protein
MPRDFDAQCRHARLASLVGGDPEKMRVIAAQYVAWESPDPACTRFLDVTQSFPPIPSPTHADCNGEGHRSADRSLNEPISSLSLPSYLCDKHANNRCIVNDERGFFAPVRPISGRKR